MTHNIAESVLEKHRIFLDSSHTLSYLTGGIYTGATGVLVMTHQPLDTWPRKIKVYVIIHYNPY